MLPTPDDDDLVSGLDGVVEIVMRQSLASQARVMKGYRSPRADFIERYCDAVGPPSLRARRVVLDDQALLQRDWERDLVALRQPGEGSLVLFLVPIEVAGWLG